MELGRSLAKEAVGGSPFLCPAGGLRQFLGKGGEDMGPPRLRPLRGAGAGCHALHCCCECGESGGDALVKLVGSGR